MSDEGVKIEPCIYIPRGSNHLSRVWLGCPITSAKYLGSMKPFSRRWARIPRVYFVFAVWIMFCETIFPPMCFTDLRKKIYVSNTGWWNDGNHRSKSLLQRGCPLGFGGIKRVIKQSNPTKNRLTPWFLWGTYILRYISTCLIYLGWWM